MASVREFNLSAAFDTNSLKSFQIIFEHVHHAYSIGESHYDVQTRRMKSHTVRFILKELAHLKLKLSGC